MTDKERMRKINQWLGEGGLTPPQRDFLKEILNRFKAITEKTLTGDIEYSGGEFHERKPEPVEGLLPCPFKPPFKYFSESYPDGGQSDHWIEDAQGRIIVLDTTDEDEIEWILDALKAYSSVHRGMTNEDALVEANKRWGDSASITVTGKGNLLYYEIFKSFSVGFEGDSWEDAFAAADAQGKP